MYALTVASGLDGGRYKNLLCAIDKGGALEGEARERGIPYFVMDRRQGIDLRLMWRLLKLFRKHKVDVVHTHHFNQLFYSAIGARLAGARIIHTEHCVEDFKRRRLRVALRLLGLLCDKVIAIGPDVRRAFSEQAKIPASKLETIRAGVDVDAFKESKGAARIALGIDERDRVAIIVARLFPEKNHLLLLRAFQIAARQVERARLLIVGDGIEEKAIREEIKRLGMEGSVEMLGVRRDIARLLAASDVFVLSSDREGLPIAALEAMAAARPVVATAVGDLPAIVRDGVTGRLVEPNDADRLGSALAEVLGRPSLAASLGANARRVVEQGYSLRSMIDRYDEIYSAR